MHADKERSQQLQIFSRAVEMSIDGIIIGELSGKITYVNDALLKIYGTTDKAEIVGRRIVEFIAEQDRERATQTSMKVLRTGKGFTGEFAALTKSGAEIPIEVTVAIINDETWKTDWIY